MTPRIGAMLLLVGCGAAHAATMTITESVSLTLASAAKLSSPATSTLTVSGSTFNNFTGSLTVNYKARTTQVGSATLTLKASSDFSPSGGPSVASANVTYTCGSAGLGNACSGTQTMSTSSQTAVVSISSRACVGTGCSGPNPSTVQLQFVLANNPQYHTGSYSAPVLFTFSTT
jgi:hypothetical protein